MLKLELKHPIFATTITEKEWSMMLISSIERPYYIDGQLNFDAYVTSCEQGGLGHFTSSRPEYNHFNSKNQEEGNGLDRDLIGLSSACRLSSRPLELLTRVPRIRSASDRICSPLNRVPLSTPYVYDEPISIKIE